MGCSATQQINKLHQSRIKPVWVNQSEALQIVLPTVPVSLAKEPIKPKDPKIIPGKNSNSAGLSTKETIPRKNNDAHPI